MGRSGRAAPRVSSAFTGAEDRAGLIEECSGGTIYLDEINSMPLKLQSKLLRVLDTKTVMPLGAIKPKDVDIRIVASVNRSPEQLMQNKEMLPDLFFRLNAIHIRVPPLRSRPEDIELQVADKLKVSRAKLAYILDSTSSPVCILIPITGWGVYVMNIIATQYEAIGIEGSDAGTFMQAIPYQFYAILALILIPVIALSKKNFGPMARSEQLALKGLTEEQMKSEDAIVVEDDKEVSMWNMLLPLIVLFVVIFAMFIGWGWPTHNIAGSKIRIALTSGYLLAAITCLIMIVKQKLMTFQQAFDIFVGGIQKMGSILAVIVVAWGVGSVCGTLGTSTFIVESTTGTLSPALVPGLLFVIGAVISFAIGSSWGTMAILLPIGINMAYSFNLDFPLVIAAVLSGSLFGDHCSPISDTTIMSSMAAGCNHIEHVKTQLPYALVAAGGSFITYLIVGFADMSAAIALPIAIVVALVLYFLCCKLFVKKAA